MHILVLMRSYSRWKSFLFLLGQWDKWDFAMGQTEFESQPDPGNSWMETKAHGDQRPPAGKMLSHPSSRISVGPDLITPVRGRYGCSPHFKHGSGPGRGGGERRLGARFKRPHPVSAPCGPQVCAGMTPISAPP